MKTIFLAVALFLSAACSAPVPAPGGGAPVSQAPKGAGEKPPMDTTPAEVKAAFPEASSIAMRMTKTKGGDDFMSYVAFTTKGGEKTAVGVATLIAVEGATFLLTVDNDIRIKRVTVVKSGGKPEVEGDAFLSQFTGKTHDDAIQIGKDIKFTGTDRAFAEKVVKGVKAAEMTLQEQYGKPHAH
jgi:hypothetical protein